MKHHQEAIALYEGEIGHGANARLQQYARQRVSVLRKHLAEANRVQKSLSGGPNGGGK